MRKIVLSFYYFAGAFIQISFIPWYFLLINFVYMYSFNLSTPLVGCATLYSFEDFK